LKEDVIIGIAASVLTGISSLPQLFKLLKEKKAVDTSLIMFIVLLTGSGLWAYYGFLKKDWILFSSSLFSFLINASVIILSMRFK